MGEVRQVRQALRATRVLSGCRWTEIQAAACLFVIDIDIDVRHDINTHWSCSFVKPFVKPRRIGEEEKEEERGMILRRY